MSSDLLRAAVQAERNAERLALWRKRWGQKFGQMPESAKSVFKRDLTGLAEAAALSTVHLLAPQPISAERHGNGNVIPLRRWQRINAKARPAPSDFGGAA